MDKLMKFLKDEEGASMVEYALLVALIAVVVIAALLLLGPAIANLFDDVTERLDDPTD